MFGIDWDNLPHPWGKLSLYLGVLPSKKSRNELTMSYTFIIQYQHVKYHMQFPKFFQMENFFYNGKLACDNLPHSDSWAEIQIY